MSRFDEIQSYSYGKIIEVYKKFTIPKFQRPYAWEKQQIKDFFSAVIENDSPYFIGYLVCLPASHHEQERLSVVDGQQRLTTISLFIAALVKKYEELLVGADDSFSRKIARRIEFCKSFLSSVDRSREEDYEYTVVELGRPSYQSTYERVLSGMDIMEREYKALDAHQQRIVDNYREIGQLLNNKITSLEPTATYEYLYDIEKKIGSLEFILIILKNANEVFSIFEGMNSTGLDLTTSDLVKNAVLKRAASQNAESIEQKWNELEEIFIEYNPKDFPNFLRRWYMSYIDYISNGQVFPEIKNKFIESSAYFENLETFLQHLVSMASFYVALRKGKDLGDFIDDDNLREAFRKFSLLNNDQVYTVLLAYYQYGVRDRRIGIKTLKKYLNTLWIFVFKSAYVSISPSDYERLFVKHANTFSSRATIESMEAFKPAIFFEKLSKLVGSEEQFIDNVTLGLRYSDNNKLLRHVLIEIMRTYSPTDRAINVATPEIEHILPQSPHKWDLMKSEIRPYVNNIGNLTVLFEGDNKSACDETFDTKVDVVYSHSHFKYNRDIVNYRDEFVESPQSAIDKRGRDVAAAISTLYKI